MISDHVFVCYSRKDEDFVLKLAENLKRMGVPIWIDQWSIPTGANWSRTIESALEECARLLIVLTPSSVQSDEVQSEWLSALDRKKTIVPILHKDCQMPFRLKPIQYIDFTKSSPDDKEALEQIVRALGTHDAQSSSTSGRDKEVILSQDAVTSRNESQNEPEHAGYAGQAKSMGGLPKNWIILAAVVIIGILFTAFILTPTGPNISAEGTSSPPDAIPGQVSSSEISASYERITFDAFPDGTPITSDIILRGDEFSAKGILLAGAPESSYCGNANAAAIHMPESMYNVDFNYLSSSDPQNINRCGTVAVGITFIEPVKKVTLTFAGASVPYTMNAYDDLYRLVDTATENATIRGGTFEITTSTENAEIKRVTFGKETAGTMIKEIYYER